MSDQVQVDSALETAASLLDQSVGYRVLRRLELVEKYTDLGGQEVRQGLVLDVETTGLEPGQDKIIELAMIPFEYGAQTGEVGKVGQPLSFLEDPGQSIPEEIVRLTGITDDMVSGHAIDDAEVHRVLSGAGIVIAHNAGFDRPFMDHRFDFAADKSWACSWNEVPWAEFGFKCAKLECLLLSKAAAFIDAHRAANDCIALLHVLAVPLPDGTVPMATLLESARHKTRRIWAVGSPFEFKDSLKAHGYRWNPGSNGEPKAWWIDVREPELEAELDWLRANGYAGRTGRWEIKKFSAKTRYRG